MFNKETSTQWSKNEEYNLIFMRSRQSFFNDLLKARGHLFLNEVYDELGLARTVAGTIVGWVLKDGRGLVDIGIVEKSDEWMKLSFNCDGVIYDLI